MKKFYEFGINLSKLQTLCLKEGLKFGHFNLNDKNLVLMEMSLYARLSVSKEAVLKQLHDSIFRAIEIESFRGYRHSVGLPVRGQRTHNNRKTQRALCKKRMII